MTDYTTLSINLDKKVITDWLDDNVSTNDLACELASEIDVYEVARYVAEDTDWDNISDALYDSIRDNNIGDIADYMKDDVSNFLMEGQDFVTLLEERIDIELPKLIDERINSLVSQINSLKATVDAMQKKKFWKKIGKGK